MSALFDRVAHVKGTIAEACKHANRSPAEVKLVAVTKTVPTDIIAQAYGAGLRVFGENRVQEAQPKIGKLPADIEWHFIGRLQRRKLKWLVGRFNLIHSVESLEQAEEIQRRAHERRTSQAVLLEVNVGGEESKGGFSPDALPSAVSQIDAFPSVCVQGLMTVPPWNPDPELMRPYFRRLKQLAELIGSLPLRRVHMHELSMGMSNDFESAVEEGATLVRVGTALFGPRREPVTAES